MVFSFPSEEIHRLNYPVHNCFSVGIHCKNRLDILAEEWLPWLQAEETVYQL